METSTAGFKMKNITREKEVNQIHTAMVVLKEDFKAVKDSDKAVTEKITEMYSLMESMVRGNIEFHHEVSKLVSELVKSNEMLQKSISAVIQNSAAKLESPSKAITDTQGDENHETALMWMPHMRGGRTSGKTINHSFNQEIKTINIHDLNSEDEEAASESLLETSSKILTVEEICQKHGISIRGRKSINLEVGGEIRIESLMAEIPKRAESFYLALITQMKIQNRSQRLPRNGIASIIGVGLNGERIGDIYEHLIEVGLLRKEGRSYFVTDLIDKVTL